MTAANTDALTPAEFDALFDGFTATVARLEALPAYAVGGAEEKRLRAWRQRLPRPERSVRTDPWLARIATSTVLDGKQWMRIRVIDDPLTDYQRYQLESYKESAAVGEQISLLPRSRAGIIGPDFWLFDAGEPWAKLVVMHYHPDGRVDRRELVENRARVAIFEGRLGAIASGARPLNEVLASVVLGG